jgi:hypothetical protein
MIKRWIAGALALAGAGFLSVACGGSDTGNGSSSNTSDTCSLGGQKCALGCSANLGCVDCTTDAACKAGAPFCVLGKCEECKTSADCGTGKACFPRDHTCHPKCTANGDCPGDSPICDVPSGTCVGCVTSAECKDPAKPVCDPIRHQCGECATNADCGAAAPACNQQNGECEQCLVDADCTGASLCGGDHKCHTACLTNKDCTDPDKPICNTTTKSCVECLTNMQCPSAAPVCAPNFQCTVCLANTDCTDPTRPVCKDQKQCVQCQASADCKDPAKPICKGDVCVQCDGDKDCPAATPKCDKNVCVP